MSLKRIRLELARTPDFPNGSGQHGYEFVAPLDDKGHLDSTDGQKPRRPAPCDGSGTIRRTSTAR